MWAKIKAPKGAAGLLVSKYHYSNSPYLEKAAAPNGGPFFFIIKTIFPAADAALPTAPVSEERQQAAYTGANPENKQAYQPYENKS